MRITKVISGLDVGPLLAQVRAHPELWDTDDSWTRGKTMSAIYDVSNIVLRWNKSPDPTKPGQGWDKPALGILSEARSIVDNVMRISEGILLGKVLITRLRPGQNINPHVHVSPPGVPRIYHTYQVPLSVAPGCVFGCDDEDPRTSGRWAENQVRMVPGNVYWFENTVSHWVTNASNEDRISMLMDVRLG